MPRYTPQMFEEADSPCRTKSSEVLKMKDAWDEPITTVQDLWFWIIIVACGIVGAAVIAVHWLQVVVG